MRAHLLVDGEPAEAVCDLARLGSPQRVVPCPQTAHGLVAGERAEAPLHGGRERA